MSSKSISQMFTPFCRKVVSWKCYLKFDIIVIKTPQEIRILTPLAITKPKLGMRREKGPLIARYFPFRFFWASQLVGRDASQDKMFTGRRGDSHLIRITPQGSQYPPFGFTRATSHFIPFGCRISSPPRTAQRSRTRVLTHYAQLRGEHTRITRISSFIRTGIKANLRGACTYPLRSSPNRIIRGNFRSRKNSRIDGSEGRGRGIIFREVFFLVFTPRKRGCFWNFIVRKLWLLLEFLFFSD